METKDAAKRQITSALYKLRREAGDFAGVITHSALLEPRFKFIARWKSKQIDRNARIVIGSFFQCRSKVCEQKIGEVVDSTHQRQNVNLLNKDY